MHDHPINTLCFAESDELVDDQGEVNRLLKKTMDEISVENRKKGASGENSVDAVLKELGVQLPEGKTCQLFFYKHMLHFKIQTLFTAWYDSQVKNKLLRRQKSNTIQCCSF